MKNNENHFLADGALFIVAIIWGSGFIVSQLALDSGLLPFSIMTIRFLVAAILMTLIFARKLKDITKKDLIAGGIVGFLLFTAFGAQIVGLQFTTPSKNAFLTATNVVMVPFLYWILSKKKPDIFSIGAAFLCLFGISFLSLEGDFSLGLGDTFSLICAIFFACHISATGFFSKKVDTTLLTIIQMWVATILSVLGAFSTENLPAVIPSLGIISVLYLGIFSTMVAFFIQTTAQKHTTSTRTAIILSTEALFGAIFSVIFLKELLTFKMIVGGVAIFLAIVTAETKWEFVWKRDKKVCEVFE